MQISPMSSIHAVRFSSNPQLEAVRADLETLLKTQGGLGATVRVHLFSHKRLTPFLIVAAAQRPDDAADQQIQNALIKLAGDGVIAKGYREFEYKNVKVEVPAPRQLM